FSETAVSRESSGPGPRARELEAGDPGERRAGAEDPQRPAGARADARAAQDRRTDDEVGAGRALHRKNGLHGRVKEATAMRGVVDPGDWAPVSADDDLRGLPGPPVVAVPGAGAGAGRDGDPGEARPADADQRCRDRRG